MYNYIITPLKKYCPCLMRNNKKKKSTEILCFAFFWKENFEKKNREITHLIENKYIRLLEKFCSNILTHTVTYSGLHDDSDVVDV